MSKLLRTVIGTGLVFGACSSSFGQGTNGWFAECLDPANTQPYSTDYGTLGLRDALIGVSLGVSGTVTYGGGTAPAIYCYLTATTFDAVGRFAFYAGSQGSVQSNFDDQLAFTTGAPTDPVGDFCYAKVLKDGDQDANSVLYGTGGLRTAYVGASKRYAITAWSDADVDVELQTKVIGDAVRLRWRMRNLKADPQTLGLLWGAWTGQRTHNASTVDPSVPPSNQVSHFPLPTVTGVVKGWDVPDDNYYQFVKLPSGKPVRNERRYDINNPKFPAYAEFVFGQTVPYGVRIENLPGPSTPDATSADLIVIGNREDILAGNTMTLHVFGDATGVAEEADVYISNPSFIQRFPPATVAPGESRDVIHYVRSSWGVSDYEDPYTVVLDAPKLISTDSSGLNSLSPNPMTIRAYVDNQYATLDKEVPLNDVRFTIFLPKGLTLASGETAQKTLTVVQPNAVSYVEWRVVADGKVYGNLPFQVTVHPTPGPEKTLSGSVAVSATPKLLLPSGPNMVTIPYGFNDTSMEDILGLQYGVDYVAYKWDADQASYVPALTVDRGIGYWIIPTSDLGYHTLQGAQLPTDTGNGGLLVNLKQGWNMIGNPYSFPVPLSQLIMVVEDSPQDSYTWLDAVANNFVQSSMVYYDRTTGAYGYTQGGDDLLQPHFGYWVYVSTYKPIRMIWPAVFAEGLPNAGRSASNGWVQNDRQWRLQLSARTVNGIDSQNYVGVLPDKKKIAQFQTRKAPAAPNQAVELYIDDTVNGQAARMAQTLTDRAVKKEWTVNVKVPQAGDVTVTWPNLPSCPRNMRYRITDSASNESHDLRSVSGYTFHMNAAGVRKLTLSMEPGGSSRPVIGNVIVTRDGRGGGYNAPVTVNYALSTDALVTVRVLNNQGKEVYTVTRGRSDGAGQNSVTWTMHDNANRTVAPGVYRVEILAETPSGDRVRRMVPINVTR